MKTTIKQLRRIIREAIEAEPQGSPYIEKIKMLGEQDPMQAFLVAQSFPDFKSMDLSFLYPGILEAIAGNIIDQIPESSYPEMESSSRGWDIGFEFATRTKRFYAADGMNLSDTQVEERKKLEAELAKTSVEAIQKYSDIIINEFDLIGVALESKSGTGKSLNLSFTFAPGETINVELESFKNVMEIAFEYWGQPRNLQLSQSLKERAKMKYSIKFQLLQEMTQKQSWQQVEKIITKITATIEASGGVEVNRKDRRNVKFMSKRTAANKMGFEPSSFPEAEARPAIYIGPEDWDPFDPAAKNRGTDIIKVSTPYPWGTGEQHRLKISDVVNDNGASLHELIMQLLEKVE